MFAVIYRWEVKKGSEEKFQEAWALRTKEIAKQFGGLGSRLHRADDGRWIAYAQWPTRDLWEQAGKTKSELTAAKQMVNEAVTSVETLFRMEVERDLLSR